jgi:hypothetical protein
MDAFLVADKIFLERERSIAVFAVKVKASERLHMVPIMPTVIGDFSTMN